MVSPPTHKPYLPGSCSVEAVDRSLQIRESTLQMLKQQLAKAHNRTVQMANKHRSERGFEVGQWVYLKLPAYQQHSVHHRSNQKLSARYYGPFEIIKKVGKIAYKLNLPPQSKIHPTFHVSLLKAHHGPPPLMIASLPALDPLPASSHKPCKVLKGWSSGVIELMFSGWCNGKGWPLKMPPHCGKGFRSLILGDKDLLLEGY